MNINGRPVGRGGNINGRAGSSTLTKGKRKDTTLSYTGTTRPGSGATSLGGFTGQNSQIMHRFVEGVSQVRFAFGEFKSAAPDATTSPSLSACPEVPSGGGTVTYACRVFYGADVLQELVPFNPSSTSAGGYASVALTFPTGARTSVTVQSGQVVYSDWVTVPAGTTKVCLRCYAVWTGNAYGGISGTGFYATNNYYNEIWDASNTNMITGGSIAYGQTSSAKSALFGEGITTASQITKPRVALIGDSRISCAMAMNDPGFKVYSTDGISYGIQLNNYSHTMLISPQSSEAMIDIVAERWVMRREFAERVDYVIVEHGFNDLGAGAAAVLSRFRELKRAINDLGAKMIVCTIYPSTQTSNTVKGATDAARVSVNTSIRASSGFGDIHDGYLEVADAVETDATAKAAPVRNGGFIIKPDGVQSYAGYVAPSGDIYNDGTHITETGRLIIGYWIKSSLNSVMPLPSF